MSLTADQHFYIISMHAISKTYVRVHKHNVNMYSVGVHVYHVNGLGALCSDE